MKDCANASRVAFGRAAGELALLKVDTNDLTEKQVALLKKGVSEALAPSDKDDDDDDDDDDDRERNQVVKELGAIFSFLF